MWRTFGESIHWRAFAKHLIYTVSRCLSLVIGHMVELQLHSFLSFLAYLSVSIYLAESTYFLGIEVKEVMQSTKVIG